MTKEQLRHKTKLSDELLKEVCRSIVEKLNRNGITASIIAEEHGTTILTVTRLTTLLRKKGKDIPKARHGLLRAVESFMSDPE